MESVHRLQEAARARGTEEGCPKEEGRRCQEEVRQAAEREEDSQKIGWKEALAEMGTPG